jgi:tocopherol cyclase
MGLKHIFKPELFQGYRKKDRYFEGWYFKLVSQDEKFSIAFIPGVSVSKIDPHLFIQVFFIKNKEHPTLETYYLRYPYVPYFYHPDEFRIQIGDSIFSNDGMTINIHDQIRIKGEVRFTHPTKIEQSLISPNVMGMFGYLGFMECYHGVLSMSHELSGHLIFEGNHLDFEKGKGYLEKDWGKSFPRAYVWIQSNHFKEDQVSFMFSYADIPFLGFYFKGLISILNINGKEYRFATYNFSKITKEEISSNLVTYHIKKGNLKLILKATKKESVDLVSPKDGLMNKTIKEGLSGVIEIELYKKEHLIYQGIGTSCGIEIMKK